MKIICTGGSGFIGTHFINSANNNEAEIINIDITAPQNINQGIHWYRCNILDFEELLHIFTKFQPTHVLHLAAKTSAKGKTLTDYVDNTVGTENVLKAIKATHTVKRVVITSTQHVRKPGSGFPNNDIDFIPHGLYGESKVISEKLTRQAELNCTWTIIRPTNIWGPMHPILSNGLWRYMKKGWYVHPKDDPVVRCYGYVKNTVWQIWQILTASDNLVHRKVFYLGEEPIKQINWINKFSNAFTGKDARVIPKVWLHLLAYIGDLFKSININFPMNSERFFNLTTTNPVPTEIAIKEFGPPPCLLEDGIRETVDWLCSRDFNEQIS